MKAFYRHRMRPEQKNRSFSLLNFPRGSLSSLKIGALLAMATSMCNISAFASETGPGLIVDLQVDGTNAAFAVGGPIINKPGCVVWGRYVFELTSPSGQAMFAYLLSAQATGKQVRVYGTGTCSIWSDHETARSVRDGQ